jgi:tripartite-type tricarboxylate transporter receptor subunit TctC
VEPAGHRGKPPRRQRLHRHRGLQERGQRPRGGLPHLFKKLPYSIDKDFEVVLPLFRTFFFVCVPVNSPYKTMADLIADAKARPGKLNYGSWSVGNPVHLGSALLESLTGTRMEHVIYKETGPLMRSGKLRFLAVLAPHRLKGYEDVPTVAESGGPADAVVTGWNAFAVSRSTPPAVVEKIRQDTMKTLREPDIQPKFQTFGYENYFPTPEEFKAFIVEENKRFGDVIRRAKIEL